MGAFRNGCAKIETWNPSPTVKWSLVLMVRGSCDLYWRPQLLVALDRLGTMEFCNTCFLVNTCKVYFVSLSQKHVARLHVLLGWNRREQKARGVSRCLQLTRWVTVEPLHSSKFRIRASLQHVGFTVDDSTSDKTKQTYKVRPDSASKQCADQMSRRRERRQVVLFCVSHSPSHHHPHPTRQIRLEGGFVLNQVSLPGTVTGKLPKKCPVI